MLLALCDESGGTRQVIVKPAPAAREAEFKRCERVGWASKGRFGYIHLRALQVADLVDSARDFYPVLDR